MHRGQKNDKTKWLVLTTIIGLVIIGSASAMFMNDNYRHIDLKDREQLRILFNEGTPQYHLISVEDIKEKADAYCKAHFGLYAPLAVGFSLATGYVCAIQPFDVPTTQHMCDSIDMDVKRFDFEKQILICNPRKLNGENKAKFSI